MRIHRFFIEQKLSAGVDLGALKADRKIARCRSLAAIKIENDELAHQWRDVLRFQVGQEVILCDNSGLEFRAVIVSIGNRAVEVEILESRPTDFAPALLVFLCIALAKRDSFEWTLEKGTELGVAGFVPLISERSEKKNINIVRSKNILKEASEQSGRAILPEIFEAVTLTNFLENLSSKNSTRSNSDFSNAKLSAENPAEAVPEIFFALDPSGEPFDVAKLKIKKRANIFIGPEGGFSPREIKLFKERNIPIYSIGKQTLRAETAAVAIASILLLA